MNVKVSSKLTSDEIVDVDITIKHNFAKRKNKLEEYRCIKKSIKVIYKDNSFIYSSKESFSNEWEINSMPNKYLRYTGYDELQNDYEELYNYIVSEWRENQLGDILK